MDIGQQLSVVTEFEAFSLIDLYYRLYCSRVTICTMFQVLPSIENTKENIE